MYKLIMVTLVLAWALPAANADEAAGIVIIASGKVQAILKDETPRPLRRRSKFYSGEVIKVAQNGKAQIRFADGTLLSLHPDTELRVDAFHYEPNGDGTQDKNFFTLLKGGFRTITGAVGKRNPDGYRVTTPVATIGVRGTNYSVALDKQLYVGVWQGGVTVKNAKGQLDLGMNAPFNFARIAGAEQTPKGLMTAPAVLLNRGDTLQPAQDSHHRAPNDEGKPPANGGAPAARNGANPPPNPDNAGKPQSGTASLAMTTPGNNPSATPPKPGIAPVDRPSGQGTLTAMPLPKPGGVPPPPINFLPPLISTFTQGSVTDTSTTLGGNIYTQPDPTTTSTTSSTGDLRLSTTDLSSLDRLGLMMPGGNPGPYPLRLVKASDGSTGNPLFVWNGLPPSDPNFSTTAAVDVIREGSATTTGVQTHGTYPVSWGVWSGTATNPVLIQTDPNDPTVTTALATQIFWVTAIPTVPTVIAGLTGKSLYKNVINYQGGSSAGNIGALYMTSIIDFGTGAVQGDMNIHAASDYWAMHYSGTVNGNLLNVAPTTSSSLISSVNGTQSAGGTLQAFFTGSNGEAIAGAFDFQTISGPLSDTDGTFLLDNTSVGDLRLTATEQASIDRIGLAVVDDNSAVDSIAAGPLLANASDGASGSPILVDTALNTAGFPVHIMRQGLTTLTNLQANPSYTRMNDSVTVTLPVSWGSWNNDLADAVVDQNNPDDPLLGAAIFRPVNWITVVPTASATIAGLSGSISYTNLVGMVGTSSGGDITSPSATAMVDFTNATVSGNMNFSNTLGDLWSTNFSGTLTGPALNITSVGGTVNSTTPIVGKVDGYMTGPKAEGMAGVFDYEANGNPAVHAEGSFLLGCGTICP